MESSYDKIQSFRFETQVLRQEVSQKITDIDQRINTFSIPFFSNLYKLGCTLTTPLTQAVRWFHKTSYHEKSGLEKYAILSLKLCVIVFATLFPTSPLGMIIRIVCSFAKNSFAYSPAKGDPETENSRDPTKPLNIMTWNVGLGPAFMAVPNELELPENRVKPIVDEIVSQDADIVCLQEVFDKDANDRLVEELNNKGYDCIHSVMPGSYFKPGSFLRPLSSGLLIAVRRQAHSIHIEEVNAWKFNNMKGEDQFSHKGVLGATFSYTLPNGNNKPLYVIDTHLQASYKKRGYGDARTEEVEGIASLVRKLVQNSEDCVLCGDFNCGPNPLEPSDKPDEYEQQVRELKGVGLEELPQDPSETLKGTFVDVKKAGNPIKESVVDHPYYSQNLRSGTTQIIDIRREGQPIASDHLPVLSKIKILVEEN